ncbi:Myosin type-2 heavy chain 1, partial [Basidiobolus ranarum]
YQIGKTKVFFRAGQLAYLEKLRSDKLYYYTVMIQKNVRRFLARKNYLRLRFRTVVVQSIIRKKFAFRLLENMRRKKAAICIQKNWRAYRERKRYQAMRTLIIKAQSYVRRHLAKKLALKLRQVKATINIQRVYRGWLVRREYRKTIKSIILIQACLRRSLAKKELRQLKIEARSANHFKEQSYQLENKLVTLTQQLAFQKDENKTLIEKINSAENQVNIWKDKYEKAEQKNTELAEKFAGSSEESKEYEALLKEKDQLLARLKSLGDSFKAKESEFDGVKEELSTTKKELLKLKTISKMIKTKKEADDKMTLKLQEEVSSLKAQLAVLSRGQKVDTVTLQAHYNLVSANSTPVTSSPVLTPSISNPMVINTPIVPPRPDLASMENPQKGGEFQPPLPIQNFNQNIMRQSVPPHAFANHMRSNSVEAGGNNFASEKDYKRMTLAGLPMGRSRQSVLGHISLPDIQNILISEGLVSEIETFLRSVAIPVQNQSRPIMGAHEILFPANIINMCVTQLWANDLGLELKRFLNKATFTIEKLVSRPERDFILPFWLSNACYLLLGVTETENRYKQETVPGLTRRNTDYVDPLRVIEKCKQDLEMLITNIYNIYLQELNKQVGKLVIPAVVESQPLNEYFVKESGFFSKLMGNSNPPPSNKILTEWLNELINTMNYYYVSELLASRLVAELVNFIGASAFNHIIMRKNFCNWKRGTQIQANVTAIEEWFKAHISPKLPTMIHLERLKQSVKLLTLLHQVRAVSILFQGCYLLNPAQIS